MLEKISRSTASSTAADRTDPIIAYLRHPAAVPAWPPNAADDPAHCGKRDFALQIRKSVCEKIAHLSPSSGSHVLGSVDRGGVAQPSLPYAHACERGCGALGSVPKTRGVASSPPAQDPQTRPPHCQPGRSRC